jgi:hypothetical protein
MTVMKVNRIYNFVKNKDLIVPSQNVQTCISKFFGSPVMRNGLVDFAVCMFVCVGVRAVVAADKIDVSTVITKSDAEAILGVPVKDAKGRNKQGTDGFYDSEWSYYAVKGDKALVFDVLFPGREAPPHLAQTMFSVLGPEGKKPTSVDGLGDKAIFYHDKTGLEMLNILKRNILITIGMHGVPAETALEKEKSAAKKILAQL